MSKDEWGQKGRHQVLHWKRAELRALGVGGLDGPEPPIGPEEPHRPIGTELLATILIALSMTPIFDRIFLQEISPDPRERLAVALTLGAVVGALFCTTVLFSARSSDRDKSGADFVAGFIGCLLACSIFLLRVEPNVPLIEQTIAMGLSGLELVASFSMTHAGRQYRKRWVEYSQKLEIHLDEQGNIRRIKQEIREIEKEVGGGDGDG